MAWVTHGSGEPDPYQTLKTHDPYHMGPGFEGFLVIAL